MSPTDPPSPPHELARATRLVRFDAAPGDPHAPVSTPIHQTATFVQDSAQDFGRYDYSRTDNPTRQVLERQLARLEGGAGALAYASGMAACAAVGGLLAAGDRVLAAADLYGGTQRLLGQVLAPRGVEVGTVDPTDLDDTGPGSLRAELARGAAWLWVESPSNPLLEVLDLRALADLAHAAGARMVVDGTCLSPWLQNPLELGADLVLHSATKHLAGHSDTTAGALVARDPALLERLAFLRNAEGTALAPFDAWLVLRGTKTLGVRLEREQASARTVARFLEAHPAVTRVRYPGLPSHPGHDLLRAQARGAGGLLSFETGDAELSRRWVEALELFPVAVSFGGAGSSASLPCRMSHASAPAELRRRAPLPPDLVRLSIGLEDPGDLCADLARAFERACGAPHVGPEEPRPQELGPPTLSPPGPGRRSPTA